MSAAHWTIYESPIGPLPLVIVEATAVKQTVTFAAAVRFAGCEGIVPGPEPAHAIKATIDEALAAKEAGEERVILLGLSGHGHFDMAAYAAYYAGDLGDLDYIRARRSIPRQNRTNARRPILRSQRGLWRRAICCWLRQKPLLTVRWPLGSSGGGCRSGQSP